jgi:hypothetical protein
MAPTNAHVYTKLFYTYNEILHVSANYVAIIKYINQKG